MQLQRRITLAKAEAERIGKSPMMNIGRLPALLGEVFDILAELARRTETPGGVKHGE